MRIVYASRKGHVEGIVNRLGITDAFKIVDGTEKVEGDYVLFTYNDGHGDIPAIVESFIQNNPGVKAVVGSGSQQFHADTFNFAAQKIADRFNVPVIAKLDMDGTEEDLQTIRNGLAAL